MSMLAMSDVEIKTIDSKVEQMMDWAKSRQAQAEQLALDSARLMACTTDRLDKLQNQNFFMRCWTRFNGDAAAAESANVSDVIQMQKTAFRYVNMLQEQDLLMAHSLLALKNNLVALSIKEVETRDMIANLAKRTLERFDMLEKRVEQLEISTNLQGWLLGLEERDYDEKYPTELMRLFRIINDFYSIKSDNWNYNDLIFMRKAIRTVNINPKQKLSLSFFIDKLVEEILDEKVGFDTYSKAITLVSPKEIDNYSKFAVENISSPVFVSMHGLKIQYTDRLDVVEDLQDEMNITTTEALKRLLRKSINRMNVNLDYEFPIAETAIELLGCMRLGEKLLCSKQSSIQDFIDNSDSKTEVLDNPSKDLDVDNNKRIEMEDANDKNDGKDVKELHKNIEKIIASSTNYPDFSSAGIYIEGIELNKHIKYNITNNYENLFNDDKIIFIFDMDERRKKLNIQYANSVKAILTLDKIYIIYDEANIKIFKYDELYSISAHRGKLTISINENEGYGISFGVYEVNTIVYLMLIIDKVVSTYIDCENLFDKYIMTEKVIIDNFHIWVKIDNGSDIVEAYNTFTNDEINGLFGSEEKKFLKKIKNFNALFPWNVAPDSILAYHDNTFMDGDRGYILTYNDIIYCNNKRDKGKINYDDMKKCSYSSKNSQLIIQTNSSEIVIDCKNKQSALCACEALNGIITNRRFFL